VNPRADRQYAIDVTRALIPALREKGFAFGTICTESLQQAAAPRLPRTD
jgi:hypothetical protein